MHKLGGGRIINFADWIVASSRPRYPGYLPYYVAKAGVKALTEGLALELAANQILVNAIAPGPILAPPDMSQEESDAVVKSTPLGRWGGEAEIVKAVMFFVEIGFRDRRNHPGGRRTAREISAGAGAECQGGVLDDRKWPRS